MQCYLVATDIQYHCAVAMKIPTIKKGCLCCISKIIYSKKVHCFQSRVQAVAIFASSSSGKFF